MKGKSNDNDWFSAFQEGDTRAFSHVYTLHYRALFFFACGLIEDKPEAEDIATESLIKLWQKRRDFDNPQSIKGFLYITTRNACFDFLKRSRRQSLSKKELLYLLEDNKEFVLSKIIYAELLQKIQREIESLPPKPRRVFELSFFENLNNREIAQRLDMPVGKVKNNKSRAFQLLRMLLEKDHLLAIAWVIFSSFRACLDFFRT